MAEQQMTAPSTSAAKSRRERQKADMRAELLAAAHQLVRQGGYDGLTIRKLADLVNYSPMAVYSYFADKDAILLALAEDAFVTLAQRVAVHQGKDPVETIRLSLMEYAAFALENPNEYVTIFMTPKVHIHDDETFDTLKRNNPCMNLLVAQITSAVEQGTMRGDVFAIATILWSAIHGAVSLLITFPKFPFGEPEVFVRRMIDSALETVTGSTIEPLGDPTGCFTPID